MQLLPEQATQAVLIGLALAGAPGPVQAVILAESVSGGARRGFRAMAGASLTFGTLLVLMALGLSFVASPTGTVIRLLRLAGGALLIWLAIDAFRTQRSDGAQSHALAPEARGSLAVLLNGGAWLFLATVASALIVSARATNGTIGAIFVAVGLMLGAAAGDAALVLFGGFGLRRYSRLALWVQRALAVILAALGLWILFRAVTP